MLQQKKRRPAETCALLELCRSRRVGGRVGRVGWTAVVEVSVTSTSIGTLVLKPNWDTITLLGHRNKSTTVWNQTARVMVQTIWFLAVW